MKAPMRTPSFVLTLVAAALFPAGAANAQEDTSLDSFLFEVQYRIGAN